MVIKTRHLRFYKKQFLLTNKTAGLREWIQFYELNRQQIINKILQKQGLKLSQGKIEKIPHLPGYKVKVRNKRILQEIPELEKQGFRCIPITSVVPDIIAIKDNKIYAIEVEYGKPDYDKYTDEIRKKFDDIIWIIRKS